MLMCTKCLTEGEHKVFNTFDYWYCNFCKDEIKLEDYNRMREPGDGTAPEEQEDLFIIYPPSELNSWWF